MTIREILADIKSDRVKKVVIDTDAYNEIDDQYAIGYSFLSDKIDILAIHAAPFENEKSDNMEYGMEMSYKEIHKVLGLLDPNYDIPVFKGSRASIEKSGEIQDSEAARNLIKVVHESDEIVYVLALGAITNVVSALKLDPTIKNNMCVIWLGGNWLEGDNLGEFNLVQDYTAGQMLLNSEVPLLLCPAWFVVSDLGVKWDDVCELQDQNPLCDYLFEITGRCRELAGAPHWWTRTIWDVAAPAILDDPSCAEIEVVPTPIFTDARVYAFDSTRHEMLYLRKIHRDIAIPNTWKHIKSARK